MSCPRPAGLTPEELNVLLSELKQIMAVYGETCRID